jgi:hypothetical protein
VNTCPNGHIYMIGECGGAMQASSCPDCGAKIGGGSHQLAVGNANVRDVSQLAERLASNSMPEVSRTERVAAVLRAQFAPTPSVVAVTAAEIIAAQNAEYEEAVLADRSKAAPKVVRAPALVPVAHVTFPEPAAGDGVITIRVRWAGGVVGRRFRVTDPLRAVRNWVYNLAVERGEILPGAWILVQDHPRRVLGEVDAEKPLQELEMVDMSLIKIG